MSKKPLPPGVPEERTPIPGGTEEKGPPPKFGTPVPADPNGPVPRVVNPLDRVDKGSPVTRFKIGAKNYLPQETRYIVARDEAEARELYLKVNGIAAEIDKLKKNGVVTEAPFLVVTALPD